MFILVCFSFMSLFFRHYPLFLQLLPFVSLFSQSFCSHRCMHLNTLLNLIHGKHTCWNPIVLPMISTYGHSQMSSWVLVFRWAVLSPQPNPSYICNKHRSALLKFRTDLLFYNILMIPCTCTMYLVYFQLYSPLCSSLHFSNTSLYNVQVLFFSFALSQSPINAGYM